VLHQKIDAPPHTKVCGLNGARFLDARNFFLKRNFCTEVCHCKQTSCARSADHILKDVVLGRHFDINKFFGDGSFDTNNLFDFCDLYQIEPIIKIRKNAVVDLEGSWKRNIELAKYKKLGYKKWAKKRKYGMRWTGTEGIFSAVKKIYGERVRAHKVDNMCLEARRKFWAYQLMKRYAEDKLDLIN